MKKTVVLVLALSALVSLSLSAQGFYFDAGIGFGKAKTKINGVDLMGELKKTGFNPDEFGVGLDLKTGYGPFERIPLFFIGEMGGIGHRIYDSNYIQFSSFMAGGGLVFYPFNLVQIGASAGCSLTFTSTDIPDEYLYLYQGAGFAWNVTAAFDLGKREHGCLLGFKYFNAINEVEPGVKESASLFSVFVKYAYRNKKPRNA